MKNSKKYHLKKNKLIPVWWHTPLISVFWRKRQGGPCELKANLVYTGGPDQPRLYSEALSQTKPSSSQEFKDYFLNVFREDAGLIKQSGPILFSYLPVTQIF